MIIDLIGKKFGRFIVIKQTESNKFGQPYWLCKCICGNEKIVRGSHLRSGSIKSYGCLNKEKTIERSTIHGHAKKNNKSQTYIVWTGIIQRCTNPKNKYYDSYGGRGISICDRWINSFVNFLQDMGEVPSGLQIGMINNDGNYCKSNCRWTTSKQNNRNRRNNRLETHNGKTQCLAAWAEETNIDIKTLGSRMKNKWSIEKALTTPVRKITKGEKKNEN